MKRLLWFPIGYLLLFGGLLWLVWGRLDNPSAVAVVSVLAGGLAGVMGAGMAGALATFQVERESEDRLKQYAAGQALELTKLELEFDRRRETGLQNRLAPAKVYREFYKALFELYRTQEWPREVMDLGLINILTRETQGSRMPGSVPPGFPPDPADG